jgi:hypothetical protein
MKALLGVQQYKVCAVKLKKNESAQREKEGLKNHGTIAMIAFGACLCLLCVRVRIIINYSTEASGP